MFLAANIDLIFVCDAARFRESKAAHHRPPIRLFLHTQSSCIPWSLPSNTQYYSRIYIMSLQTIIPMFVTCMAPLFLVYFIVHGIYMLQLDRTIHVSEEPESDAPAQFKSFIVLCAALATACAVLSIYTAMFGGRKRAEEENAGQETVIEDLGQRDDGGMGWFDIDLLKNDSEVAEEEEKRFHFFDVEDGIGDVRLESGNTEDNIEKESLGSANGLG